jgi:charged multivesicular body protein 7
VGDEGLLGSSSSVSHKGTRWWGDYVVVSLLERAADEVLRMQRGKAGGAGDRLFTFEGFRNTFGTVLSTETSMTEGDTKVLLRFLERDRKAIVFDGEVCSTIRSVLFIYLPGYGKGDQIYYRRNIYAARDKPDR